MKSVDKKTGKGIMKFRMLLSALLGAVCLVFATGAAKPAAAFNKWKDALLEGDKSSIRESVTRKNLKHVGAMVKSVKSDKRLRKSLAGVKDIEYQSAIMRITTSGPMDFEVIMAMEDGEWKVSVVKPLPKKGADEDDEDDEDEAPRSKKTSRKKSVSDDEDDEDEAPRSKKTSGKKSVSDDEEDEDDGEKPAKKAYSAKPAKKAGSAKPATKKAVKKAADPDGDDE